MYFIKMQPTTDNYLAEFLLPQEWGECSEAGAVFVMMNDAAALSSLPTLQPHTPGGKVDTTGR